MALPPWLLLGIAVLVIAFGLYRIRLAIKPPEPEPEPDPAKRPLVGGGFYRMSSRTHVLVGVIYLLLGAALVATTFGWRPLGGLMSSSSSPAPSPAPKGGIPVAPAPSAK